MTRIALLAVAFVAVIGSTSAFSPIVVTTTSSSSNRAAATATTTAFLVPEQGRQLVAFSQDYLSKKAKDSAGKASNLRGDRGRSGGGSDPSTSSSSPQGKGGVGPAAKGIVTRLLGHDNNMGGSTTRERSLEEELMNKAYPRDPNCHSEEFCNSDDEVLFHQIVD